jgi:hypothetical protein
MGTIELPPDLLEFLRLLNSHEVEYLLVGGYAVIIYGYPRTTGDMDVWSIAHLQMLPSWSTFLLHLDTRPAVFGLMSFLIPAGSSGWAFRQFASTF